MEMLFQISTALLLCHEMDAIKQKEWRILPILRSLNDDEGYKWFTVLHLPLYFLLLSCMFSENILLWFFVSCFYFIHGILHLILWRHPKNTFNNFISQLFIQGAALFGLIYMIWFTLVMSVLGSIEI